MFGRATLRPQKLVRRCEFVVWTARKEIAYLPMTFSAAAMRLIFGFCTQ